MRTKNTYRYYCAVSKEHRLGDFFSSSVFYKQKRKAIMFAENLYGKDNYIIVFWDFINKKEGEEMNSQIIRAAKAEIKAIEEMYINGEIDENQREQLLIKIEKDTGRELEENRIEQLYSPY